MRPGEKAERIIHQGVHLDFGLGFSMGWMSGFFAADMV
jgi:hypothetical protein